MPGVDILFDTDQVRVLRMAAPNPGPLTGAGTNSYLLLGERVVVIDPGPEIETHRTALLDALDGARLDGIVITHPHLDHSAGAPALSAATSAPIYGAGAFGADISPLIAQLMAADGAAIGGGEGADHTYLPARRLHDGEALFGGDSDFDLRAIATPGHTSTHLCFALEVDERETGVVFTGDHVMGWATSLVSPPDGDMGAFMRSLARLSERDDSLYLPGHGEAINDPAARLAELTAHRMARRNAIAAALEAGPRRASEIREAVYQDLAPFLAPAADRNVLAHLIELVEDGSATLDGALTPTAQFRRA